MKVSSILIILIVAVCCTVNVESADWPQPNGGSYYSPGKRRNYGPQFEAFYREWQRWLERLKSSGTIGPPYYYRGTYIYPRPANGRG